MKRRLCVQTSTMNGLGFCFTLWNFRRRERWWWGNGSNWWRSWCWILSWDGISSGDWSCSMSWRTWSMRGCRGPLRVDPRGIKRWIRRRTWSRTGIWWGREWWWIHGFSVIFVNHENGFIVYSFLFMGVISGPMFSVHYNDCNYDHNQGKNDENRKNKPNSWFWCHNPKLNRRIRTPFKLDFVYLFQLNPFQFFRTITLDAVSLILFTYTLVWRRWWMYPIKKINDMAAITRERIVEYVQGIQSFHLI